MAAPLPLNDDGTLAGYAWPGGYPLVYEDREGNNLCVQCAELGRFTGVPQEQPVACSPIESGGESCLCDACDREINDRFESPGPLDSIHDARIHVYVCVGRRGGILRLSHNLSDCLTDTPAGTARIVHLELVQVDREDLYTYDG